MEKSLEVTVVGDAYVGKTCLLHRFAYQKFYEVTIATVFDKCTTKHAYDDAFYELVLNDTAGQEEFADIRRLQYNKTDIFVVCFGLDDRTSFDNVQNFWLDDIKTTQKDAMMILIGTKCDINSNVINDREIQRLKSKMRAHVYLECSAKTGVGIGDVFNAAIDAYLKKNLKKMCLIS